MGLTKLGWNAARDEQFAPYLAKGCIPARVAVEDKHFYRIWTVAAELTAQITGKLIHEARGNHARLPKVGDWVAVKLVANEEKAAIQAARDALNDLGDAKPVLALVLVDTAWQMLLQAQPERVINAIQEVLGIDVPIAGGFTLGQILPSDSKITHPRFMNQHIVVALFSEPKTK